MPVCAQCGGTEGLAICTGCEKTYCEICIRPGVHDCTDEHLSTSADEPANELEISYCSNCGNEVKSADKFCSQCGAEIQSNRVESETSSPLEKREVSPGQQSNMRTKGSKSNLVAGAILIFAGVVISLTGIGVLIGVPLGMLGFAVMFPRFTGTIVVLAVLTFLLLLLA